jgi:hypothetical protein
MSNLSQFLQNSAVPVGQSVQMPALANAGTNQFVTAANELYVNTATASVVPQSSCSPLLPAALGAVNDVILPTSQVSLASFQMASNVPASGFYAGLITSAAMQSTKGFYVGGVYYLFSPNDTTNTIGWISTTDTVNYTGFVPITPLAGLMIVDVFYNAANAMWCFLEANGTIFTTSNLTTFANATFYSLPALATANGYVRLTNINGTWYAVGGSTTGSGYRVSSSANLTAWTVVIENTAGGAPAFNIVQGAGAGAATEILVICNNNTILKSTNNGTSFTAVTPVLSVSGQTVQGLNNVFYSARTGLYYLAATISNYTYVAVSTTGTLASAGWTAYSTGYLAVGNSATANINFIDTGTWVGPVFSTTVYGTYFFYGASYNTLSSPILTAAQQMTLETAASVYYQGCKAMWLNNALIVAYSGQPDPTYAYQRPNALLAVASGATCSSGIGINLWFPVSSTGVSPPQWGSWSGVTWFNGAYYAAAGAFSAQGATYFYYYALFLYKIASSLATFSCPLAPVSEVFGVALESCTQMTLSCPMPTPNGTGLYWAASQNSNAYPQQAVSTIVVFSFNGSVLTACSLSPSSSSLTGTNTSSINGYSIAGQPNGSVSVPKWSSLLNAYVLALPATASYSGTGSTAAVAVGTVPSLSSSSLSNLITSASWSSAQWTNVFGLDVLSSGGVVMVIQSSTSLSLSVCFGAGVINVFSSTYNNNVGNNTPNSYAMWEIVSNGVSYLAYAYQNTNTYLNIYKLSTTDGPTLVVNACPIPNLNLAATVTNNLRRAFNINGSFYLGDTAAASSTVRNSLMLTPNGLGSFSITPEWLQVAGDATPAGKASTYTTQNTITTVSTTGVPAVFIPAGAAGSFLKVK